MHGRVVGAGIGIVTIDRQEDMQLHILRILVLDLGVGRGHLQNPLQRQRTILGGIDDNKQ